MNLDWALVNLYLQIYIDTYRISRINTCIFTNMLFSRSGSKRVHIDTLTNVTDLNWN